MLLLRRHLKDISRPQRLLEWVLVSIIRHLEHRWEDSPLRPLLRMVQLIIIRGALIKGIILVPTRRGHLRDLILLEMGLREME
jgi:hypothetical protein